MSLTYWEYLKIDELIDLQQPKSDGPEHDEMLFIIIHQVYELWFKQMLHEGDRLCDRLTAGDDSSVGATMERMLTILKTMVAQVDILETMTPVSFTSFRSFLASSSGFESAQFREFEFMCGYKREKMLAHHENHPSAYEKLKERYAAPSIYDAFLRFLTTRGYDVPTDALERDLTESVGENAAVQDLLVRIYHEDPPVRSVCESIVDLDEGVQEWRYRHVKMVERTIGFKRGTGGSPGVPYLQSTLFRPFFPDLWAIRVRL